MKLLLAGLMLLAPALGADTTSAALPPVPLYTAMKPEMYKYAFPNPGSTVDSRRIGGNQELVYGLKADVWSGGGIGVDKQRLRDYVATGALTFYVRGTKGGETADIGFVQAKGLEATDLAYQILLPLDHYVHLGTAWQKVTIPLKDFPRQGTKWIESENRNATGDFNWDRVLEFTVSRAPGGTGQVGLAFADVEAVGSYDAAALAATQPKIQVATGPVVFYGDAFANDGGGAYAYPSPPASILEVAGGHASQKCLKVNMVTTAWSGGGIYRSPLDLHSYVAKGVLEVWAKGAKGGEEIYLGLVDKAHGASLRLSANTYLPGGLSKDWQRIQIPLRDFPKQGTKWDETKQMNLSFDFDWTKVGEVLIDNNGPDHDNGTVFLDDIAVKPAP